MISDDATTPQNHNGAPCPIMIGLLGTFRLLKRGHLVAIRPGSKTETLLAYLALRIGQPVPRETLMQALWPNSDGVLASHSLRSLLHSLYNLLGDALGDAPPVLHTAGYYEINIRAGVTVDVTQFEAFVQTGDQRRRAGQLAAAAASYGQAIALYRGDLYVGDGSLHAVMAREHLRTSYLSVLTQLASYRFDQQDYQVSLELAWQLLKSDPCNEHAHRLVMRCYMRIGDRSAALHQYRLCKDILRSEFDTGPEPATVALFDQIRLNQPERSPGHGSKWNRAQDAACSTEGEDAEGYRRTSRS